MSGNHHEMDPTAFVPPNFAAPTSLETSLFRLEPLGPRHNEADYAAWASSIEPIRRTPGYPVGKWPDARSFAETSWVRASRAELDVPLWREVSASLATAWPFEAVDYAKREERNEHV